MRDRPTDLWPLAVRPLWHRPTNPAGGVGDTGCQLGKTPERRKDLRYVFSKISKYTFVAPFTMSLPPVALKAWACLGRVAMVCEACVPLHALTTTTTKAPKQQQQRMLHARTLSVYYPSD